MNPYQALPEASYWKKAVCEKHMFDIEGLWQPKFDIKQTDAISTYGSCFAQHIGQALKTRGFNWYCSEKRPQGLKDENAKLFNYEVFSARTGNLYTTSLLYQWLEWAAGKVNLPEEVWEKSGRFYDPFRPLIEPNGFMSSKEVMLSREQAIHAFKQSVEQSCYFVFTLGLTESWVNAKGEYEYPMCPGTVAGEFDSSAHVFKNQQFSEVLGKLVRSIELMRSINSNLKFILTVSPVPLTATKSSQHVLLATMQSKSVLRAVAGQLAQNRAYVDYFPSYEIINSPVYKGVFFEPNLRTVNPYGVKFVMDTFFKCLENTYGGFSEYPSKQEFKVDDEVCEEQLLEAFSQ